MKHSLRYLGALVATNLKSSVALRGAFLARVVFMFLNNFIFLVMWWVFFEKYDAVRGWRLPDTAATPARPAARKTAFSDMPVTMKGKPMHQ